MTPPPSTIRGLPAGEEEERLRREVSVWIGATVRATRRRAAGEGRREPAAGEADTPAGLGGIAGREKTADAARAS